MLVDGLHEQPFDLGGSKGFFRKGIEFGFGQNLCQRGNALHGGSTGNKMVRPLPSVAFLVVTAAVFKLLLFVLELDELALIVSNLGFQFGDGFSLCHSV